MANKWKEKRIGELGRIVTGKTPSTLNPNYFGHDICFITPRDMNGNKKINKTERNLSNEGALVVKNCILPPCSICVSCIGSDMGKVVMTTKESVTNQQLNSIICDKNHDPNFVYYAITNLSDDLRNIAFHSTAVPILNKKDFSSFSIMCPAIENQHAIAHILATLDDKIELLRQMNETLEAMARALFKSWFIDFDPVHKKEEGKPTGLPPEIDALFPDSFEDSKLGEIPNGWRIGSILEQARLLSGGTPKTDHIAYWDGNIPWASAKDVSQCKDLFLLDTERRITPLGLAESATKIIPAYSTVVVARGATTGRMVLLGQDMAINQTCYALASITKTPLYLFFMLREAITILVHAAHGSVFDTITTSTFNSSQIIMPKDSIMIAFEKMIAPDCNKMLMNIKEADRLCTLRNHLLPRLISGNLELSDKMISKILEPVK